MQLMTITEGTQPRYCTILCFRSLRRSKKYITMASQAAALRQLQGDIRQRLRKSGTDVNLNDSDPTGDGDQSPLDSLSFKQKQVYYRDLFAHGGDITECLGVEGHVSTFAISCIIGGVPFVEDALKKATDENAAEPSKELISLLETRETSMRLSPLLLIVSAGKNIQLPPDVLSRHQVEVAKILLKYGARPDAKDVSGKTVCHYGSGMMATNTTMEIATMCIEAAESSHFFGKEVELYDLKNETMNGKQGIARGYDTASNRRAVYIFSDEKQVAVKPENI